MARKPEDRFVVLYTVDIDKLLAPIIEARLKALRTRWWTRLWRRVRRLG